MIISGIALACLTRIGHLHKSVIMLGLLCSQLEHNVHSSSLDKLLNGIGQGSCTSPIIWGLLNQLLLTAL
jgi:hypothetical protein